MKVPPQLKVGQRQINNFVWNLQNRNITSEGNMIADKDYYLDKDRKLTDDPEKGAFHLIREGQEIPKEMADEYGIGKRKTAAADESAENAGDGKKASGPTANKSAKAKDNK